MNKHFGSVMAIRIVLYKPVDINITGRINSLHANVEQKLFYYLFVMVSSDIT